VTNAPDAVAALAAPVAEAIPVIAARIPAGPAAELGRLGAATGALARLGAATRVRRAGSFHTDRRPIPSRLAVSSAESPVLGTLSRLRPLLMERLLGALELTVPELHLAAAWDPPPFLREPLKGYFAYGGALGQQKSDAQFAVAILDQLRPGISDLTLALTRQLADDQRVAGLLAAPPAAEGGADDASIAAAHGTAYLALAVATASAVAGAVPVPQLPGMDRPGSAAAAVIGLAAGVASLLLRETPMPAGYAVALLEKARAQYRLPVRSSALITVSEHRFALAEDEFPVVTDFTGNGLVAAVAGGAVIRTGRAEGDIAVELQVLDEEPPLEATGWDEVVEVSWRAAAGPAAVIGPTDPDEPAPGGMAWGTPPWPGDYRLRVHAVGRDDDVEERYQLTVWRAPAAPEIVHKRTDRLGHRLRGEPEPTRPGVPERAYRWLEETRLAMGATVTVVTGSTIEATLRALGADPARPESLRAIYQEVAETMSLDPWIAVLDAGPAVIAVEYNGWQGTDRSVLSRASAGGRAASMFWSNGATRCSFAEGGRLLVSFPWLPELEDADIEPSVAAALEGLDSDDHSRHWVGAGLIAVQRFTGYGLTAEDLERIEAADIAFRIAGEP
jgi:hypothetical protein